MNTASNVLAQRVTCALTAGIADVVRCRRHRSSTALTEAVLSTEGDALPSRKGQSEKHRKTEVYRHRRRYSASEHVHMTDTHLHMVHTKQAGW